MKIHVGTQSCHLPTATLGTVNLSLQEGEAKLLNRVLDFHVTFFWWFTIYHLYCGFAP